MDFWSWGVWLQNYLELVEFSSRILLNRPLVIDFAFKFFYFYFHAFLKKLMARYFALDAEAMI
jgi:hypothetical protein